MSDSETSELIPKSPEKKRDTSGSHSNQGSGPHSNQGYQSVVTMPLGEGYPTPSSPTIREQIARGISVTDIHDNITLSWHKLNVFVQPQTRKICKKRDDANAIPKQILDDGK